MQHKCDFRILQRNKEDQVETQHKIPLGDIIQIQSEMSGYNMLYVCAFIALITTLVLCATSQDLVTSVSVRKVHVVLSTAGF